MFDMRKKHMRWLLGVCVFAAALSAPLFLWGQEARGAEFKTRAGEIIDKENIVPEFEYSVTGAVNVVEDLELSNYMPWLEGSKLASLDRPASLSISGDYPTLDGATMAYPLYAAAADAVYAVNEKAELKLLLDCSRTEEAYEKLIKGESDMIFVLQPSDEQLQAAKDAGVELRFTPLAKDAFVFFVNSRNPVSGLSLEQIRDVYRKKITNWKELGGEDRKILPFQRPANSGSQTAMVKEVMKGEALPQALHRAVSLTMRGMYFDVANYRNYDEAIGYSFRFFTEEMMRDVSDRQRLDGPAPVKLLAVDGVEPSAENIRSGTYPLTVDLFAVTAGTSTPNAEALLAWLLSPQGQELIKRAGYVGVAAGR